MERVYKSTLKKPKLGTFDDATNLPITLNRGLYETEIETMLNAPFDVLPHNPYPKEVSKAERDHLIITLLWETWARVNELLNVNITDIDFTNRTILLRVTKKKVRTSKAGERYSETVERMTDFSEGTKRKIIKYLNGRSQGFLFLGNKGKQLSNRAVRKLIHKYAVERGIQQVIGYDEQKNPRFLITPKAFREAGEAYALMNGMESKTAANRAGHTEIIQQRNYMKYDAIRARDLADKHRPMFKG